MPLERHYSMKNDFEPPDFEKDSIKKITHKLWSSINHEFDKLWDHISELKEDHKIEKKGQADLENKVSNMDGKMQIMILMLIGGLGLLGAILGFTIFR